MPSASNWMLTSSAISVEQAPGNGRALSLAHASYPYVRQWTSGTGGAKRLVRIAGRYLEHVRPLFQFPADLQIEQSGRFTNQVPSRLHLTWLPITNVPFPPGHGHGAPDPRISFWSRRFTDPAAPLSDLNFVLVAVPTLLADDADSAIGSRLGLRVTARVVPQSATDYLVGITGSACSAGLIEALGVEGPEISPALAAYLNSGFKDDARGQLRAALGLEPAAALYIGAVRLLSGAGSEASIELTAHLPRPSDRPGDVAYALTARAVVRDTGQVTIETLNRFPLVAHQENLFVQDPPSLPRQPPHTITEARANRAPLELAQFTIPVVLPGIPAGPGNVPLLDNNNQVEVRQSELLGGNPTQVEIVQLPVGHPRTNPFAAVSAYMHARGLFDRMRSYGLLPEDFFKYARFPLIVRYRTTISPGPGKDGRTVNAAVDYDPPRVEFGQGWVGPQDLRAPLQVRYALGDLKRSASGREPLGIAADPRWSWHEFGHVLLAAATGGLELPFCHSVGDALAAIACDPDSRLAAPPFRDRFRGATFPWVHIGRRHDREVSLGWGWCGSYHRPGQFPEYTNNAMRKGYHSEQILSSSLFRLYRALGGDDVDLNNDPDPAARLRAADYVIYLIMRAVRDLPAAINGSAETPIQFADALMAADTGTLPALAGPLAGRVGGWAHKVIRWAFEAQGLYGNVPDEIVRNAPGEPRNIDVYIDNGRPNSQGLYTRGGYMPVSLHWDPVPGAEPWLATPLAMVIDPNTHELRVRVRNRSGLPVNSVRVRGWVADWPQAQAIPPLWNHQAWAANTAVWTRLGNSPSPQRAIPANGQRLFPAFTNLPAQQGRYLVLAAVEHADDPPNISPDAVQPLPTAAHDTPLAELVAGDNNMALVVYTVP